jgi:rhamnosyltransferase
MSARSPGTRACCAVVLYRPDPKLLLLQVAGLGGMRLIAFANGPLEPAAAEALSGANLYLIESADNLGLGHGLNAVMAAAETEGFSHVMLLDQDTEPSAAAAIELLGRMLHLEQARGHVALLAPLLTPPNGEGYKPIRYEWRGVQGAGQIREVDFAPTSGSLVSLAAFHAIGPFRDDFFIGGIDVEWGFRAWAVGWASCVAKDIAMPHRWGTPAEADGEPQILRHSPLRNYFYARNVIATARLAHVPIRWRAKSLAVLAAQLILVSLRGRAGTFNMAWRGVTDGLRGRMGAAPKRALAAHE